MEFWNFFCLLSTKKWRQENFLVGASLPGPRAAPPLRPHRRRGTISRHLPDRATGPSVPGAAAAGLCLGGIGLGGIDLGGIGRSDRRPEGLGADRGQAGVVAG